MAYQTVANLKVYLGIPSATTTDDTLLTTLLANAQSIIENYTRRVFECAEESTVTHDAITDTDHRSRQILYLRGDVCEISEVVNGDGDTITDYVTLPRSETPYFAIRLLRSAYTAWTYITDQEDSIEVTGLWAYSETPPSDIVHATTRLAAYLYHQKDNAMDLDRAVISGGATILPVALPTDLKQLLEPYRRIVPVSAS